MPKARRDRSVSFDSHRRSPYSRCSNKSYLSSSKCSSDHEDNLKEWEEARCPVCMEHPHNAILLICSSHEKGCRPYMCDTSYRHSNCFDQFQKSFLESSSTNLQDSGAQLLTPNSMASTTPESTVTDLQEERSEDALPSSSIVSVESPVKPKLLCPLCRGQIKDWIVVEPARKFMDEKCRSCSSESCEFSGTYSDLRKHARVDHPSARPSDVDPERQRNWRRLERQRDLGDLLSTLQSSVGEERSEDGIMPADDNGWLTVFLFIRVLRPTTTGSSPSTSRTWSSTPRARTQQTVRRSTRLWGESHNAETGSSSRDDQGNESSDGGSTRASRWRRRLRRRANPENQQ